MEMNKEEMMKLFDYILENKDIVIGKKGLFSRDTLIMMRAIIKGKLPNDFQLSEKQKEIILNSFLNSNNGFDDDTPTFIIENRKCDLKAIENDINSINFINVSDEDEDLKKYIIDEALKQNFVLKRTTPFWLRTIYDIALNSIKNNNSSANFIEWDSFSEEQVHNLIDVAIKNNYTISSSSCSFLKRSKDIVLESIKKDKNNIIYADESMLGETEIFKYLLLNGYEFGNRQLRNNGIFHLKDIEVMDFYFKGFGIYNTVPESIRENFKRIINSSLNASPTLKDFESIFDMIAEEEWKEYRKENFEMFENIFGKICSELQNHDDFEDAIDDLDFNSRMQGTLNDKYNMIYNAMKEFFEIYHSDVSNKLEKLQPSKNIIAKLSALYVSKSKEDYKKEKIDDYNETIQQYFSLKKEHPIVIKKIIQQEQKYRFEKLYDNKDAEVHLFLNEILKKYSSQLSEKTINLMIKQFASYHCSNLDEFINSPRSYGEYKRYEKVCKLINRLNNGYIQFDGIEVKNYKDLIEYDEDNKVYIYSGKIFSDEEIARFNNYKQEEKIFDKIKKDIMSRVRTIDIKEDEIDEEEYNDLAEELPFEDEYFRFDAKDTLRNINFSQLEKILDTPSFINVDSFTNQESLNGIYNLLVNNGIILLLLILKENSDRTSRTFNDNGINAENIFEIVNNMPTIVSLAKEFKIDISNFNELSSIHTMSKCANEASISILGKDIIQKLCKYREYTEEDEERIIELATELVCEMPKKDKSTVPYISGETSNYKYSMYDSLDETLLLAGINTDACFRVDGNDHDFLHYCALNKNGFVIKITDCFGNFIARASGFRNGNAVYINQLRTIYDEGGNYYRGEYKNEQNDIIETFKQACKDIVSISQNNPKEKDKIDFVFVTQSYTLDDYPSNVSDDVESAIGDNPMDNESEDWDQYIENTNNLRESEEDGFFYTDYGDYPLICFASSKGEKEIVPEDIKPKNVSALYERKRNKIFATSTLDLEVYRKINKINAIKRYHEDEDYQEVEIPIGSVIFIGDNWFIIFNNGAIINSCLLDFDQKAKKEYEITTKELTQYTISHSQQQINVEQIVLNIETQSSPEVQARLLKIHYKKSPNSLNNY